MQLVFNICLLNEWDEHLKLFPLSVCKNNIYRYSYCEFIWYQTRLWMQILRPTPLGKCHDYHPHFLGEETEAQKEELI